MDLCWWWWW